MAEKSSDAKPSTAPSISEQGRNLAREALRRDERVSSTVSVFDNLKNHPRFTEIVMYTFAFMGLGTFALGFSYLSKRAGIYKRHSVMQRMISHEEYKRLQYLKRRLHQLEEKQKMRHPYYFPKE